jgi:hypothetical protein
MQAMTEEIRRESVIGAYSEGTLDLAEIQRCLAETWLDILGSPHERLAAAEALEIDAVTLEQFERPPIQIKTGESGIGASSVAILVVLWVAQDVILAAFRDLAKDEIKKRVKRLWSAVVEPSLRQRLPDRHGLGSPSEFD